MISLLLLLLLVNPGVAWTKCFDRTPAGPPDALTRPVLRRGRLPPRGWIAGRRHSTSRGDKVVFRIADAFVPSAEELKVDFPDRAELEGTVVDFSDSGGSSNAFVIVEVIQKHTVVLPIKKLKLLNAES